MGNNNYYYADHLTLQSQLNKKFPLNSITFTSNKKLTLQSQMIPLQQKQPQLNIIFMKNYKNSLSVLYYPTLVRQLPKSINLWTVNDMQIWLNIIGMKNHYDKFKKESIDGSSIYLLDRQDWRSIGIKSVINLGILQVWKLDGFMGYQNFLQQHIKDAKNQQQCSIKHIMGSSNLQKKLNKMIKTVSKIDFNLQKNQKKQKSCITKPNLDHFLSSQNMNSSIKIPPKQQQSRFSNSQKNLTQKLTKPKRKQFQQNLTKKLQILDKQANICLTVQDNPCYICEQFDQIYQQCGVTKIDRTKIEYNFCNKYEQNNKQYQYYDETAKFITKKNIISLKKQMKTPFLSNQGNKRSRLKSKYIPDKLYFNQQNQSQFLYSYSQQLEKQFNYKQEYIEQQNNLNYENILKNMQIIVAKYRSQRVDGSFKQEYRLSVISYYKRSQGNYKDFNFKDRNLQYEDDTEQYTIRQTKTNSNFGYKNQQRTRWFQQNSKAKIDMIAQYMSQKQQEQLSTSKYTSNQPDINVYKSITQAQLIPVQPYIHTKQIRTNLRNKYQNSSMQINRKDCIGVFKFVIKDYSFVPQLYWNFPKNSIEQLQQQSEQQIYRKYEVNLNLHTVDSNIILKTQIPLLEQLQQYSKKKVYNSKEQNNYINFCVYIICIHTVNKKLCLKSLCLQRQQELGILINKLNQKYQCMGNIIYVRNQKKYYLCQADADQIKIFMKNKFKQIKYSKQADDILFKRQKIQQRQSITFKSQGIRNKQLKKHKQNMQQLQKSQFAKECKDNSYNNQIKYKNKQKIWLKLPIIFTSTLIKSFKLTNKNSIKINKGMNLKIGNRQFLFNINTIVIKFVDQYKKQYKDQDLNDIGAYIGNRNSRNFIGQNFSILVKNQQYNRVKQYSQKDLMKQGYSQKSVNAVGICPDNYNFNRCILCYDRFNNCIYLNCRHNVTCLTCGKMLDVCPVCRQPISEYLRLYND